MSHIVFHLFKQKYSGLNFSRDHFLLNHSKLLHKQEHSDTVKVVQNAYYSNAPEGVAMNNQYLCWDATQEVA